MEANMKKYPYLLASSLILISSCTPREDDKLEPNDTKKQATLIHIGKPIKARANQRNPDFFKIHVKQGKLLQFELKSLGLEDCPKFRLIDPNNRILYSDKRLYACGRMQGPGTELEGTRFEVISGFGYKLQTKIEHFGFYYLIVTEGGHADNIFPYSWDYELKATVK